MIIVVTGGRGLDNQPMVWGALDAIHAETPITSLFNGGAKGVDRLAYQWAHRHIKHIVTLEAAWGEHGKKAGPIRNVAMLSQAVNLSQRAQKPVRLVAFPGGPGTAHCISVAAAMGLEIQRVAA
jgi:hypothetical protein